MKQEPHFIPFRHTERPADEMFTRAMDFYRLLSQRRSLRTFDDREVDRELIELAIRTAGTAPSGANKQPWQFVVVSDPEVKKRIRVAAEAEEKLSYEHRMPQEWLDALSPLATDWRKPYLEEAPWLVVVFAESYEVNSAGEKSKNYYVQESVGIACGLFLAAVHNMGLVTLTHTPSPMGFLRDLLGRPERERPFLLMPVGYPAPGSSVPDLARKKLNDFCTFVE